MNISCQKWGRKPAGVLSYGGANGARGVEQLRLVLIELRMAPLRDAVHIAGVWDKLDGDRFDPDPKDTDQLNKVLDGRLWWGRALKQARRRT